MSNGRLWTSHLSWAFIPFFQKQILRVSNFGSIEAPWQMGNDGLIVGNREKETKTNKQTIIWVYITIWWTTVIVSAEIVFKIHCPQVTFVKEGGLVGS